MKVLIIEDEKLTAQWLETLLNRYDPRIKILAQLPSVTKTVHWFKENQNDWPDLLFLDIHLEDDLGFRIIEELQLTIPVIFTTAYDDYMLQAFKVNSIDYLLKPIEPNELAAALDKFKTLWQNKPLQPTENNVSALLQILKNQRPQPTKTVLWLQ